MISLHWAQPHIPARDIPGTRATCQLCKRQIVWAITVAGPSGPGGKAQPFDPVERPEGNVAITASHRGRALARALQRDEYADRPVEWLAMPHVATCPAPAAPEPIEPPPGVINLDAARRRRRPARR